MAQNTASEASEEKFKEKMDMAWEVAKSANEIENLDCRGARIRVGQAAVIWAVQVDGEQECPTP